MARFNKLDVLGILQEHGAIHRGHFRLPSGLHTATYIETAVVMQYPHLTNKIARALSELFPAQVDVVVSPAMGAVVLGQEVARLRRCRSIFFERMGGAMGLYRHFRLSAGERVLVVEDILSAGRSTSEVVALSATHGAKIVGVGAVVDRSTVRLPFTVPVRALMTMPTVMKTPDDCELCGRQVPLTLPEDRRLWGTPPGGSR